MPPRHLVNSSVMECLKLVDGLILEAKRLPRGIFQNPWSAEPLPAR